MSDGSDNVMILATACPHCNTECEFDLPPEARTDVELARQIRIVCHSCGDMFQPVGDDIAGSEDYPEAQAQSGSDGMPSGDANQDHVEFAETDNPSQTSSDGQSPDDEAAEQDSIAGQANLQKPAKRSSFGIIFLSLSILLLAGAIAGSGYWLANSNNPAIKSFVETRVLQIEPARFEATRANFERKQTEMGETLQILVEIANVGGQAATPKDVSLQLLNENGDTVFSWIMDTSKTVIEPDASANYLARMVAPPADIADIRVVIPSQD